MSFIIFRMDAQLYHSKGERVKNISLKIYVVERLIIDIQLTNLWVSASAIKMDFIIIKK